MSCGGPFRPVGGASSSITEAVVAEIYIIGKTREAVCKLIILACRLFFMVFLLFFLTKSVIFGISIFIVRTKYQKNTYG